MIGISTVFGVPPPHPGFRADEFISIYLISQLFGITCIATEYHCHLSFLFTGVLVKLDCEWSRGSRNFAGGHVCILPAPQSPPPKLETTRSL